MKATASIFIARPIADVFDFITDVAKMPSWVTGVQSSRRVSDAMGEGARYVLEYNGGWRSYEIEVAVTGYDPPALFAATTARGPFAFEGTTTLKEVEGGTRVSNLIEAGPDSLASRMASLLLGWLLRPSMSRRLLRELQALQNSIESDSSLRS
jgi:uncharacterized protein YndB with AHSA1/START domain